MRSAACLLLTSVGAFPMPTGMIGTWTPEIVPHAILGPNRFIQRIKVAKDEETGDFWLSAIDGQDFRVSGSTNEMQYCFSAGAYIPASEQAPFYTEATSDSQVDFCWRGEAMPTHKAGCQGCDCAKISLELKDKDTLHFTFWMSPPVIHAHVEAKYSGAPPNISFYKNFLGPKRCEFQNKTGLLPMWGDSSPADASPRPMRTCPVLPNLLAARSAEPVGDEEGRCRQLDGLNYKLDPANVPDVRLQYKRPQAPCWPCDVQYSVSAGITDSQYIALGFKGMGYAILLRDKDVRPNYFGMATDPLDENRTGTAIALGYGGCFREMRSEAYVGSVVDVAEGQQLKQTSVERRNGRTILRFTVSQYVGETDFQMNRFFDDAVQLSARVMWAIGDVADVSDCNSTLLYHQHLRGVAPLNWLSVGAAKCEYDPLEIDGAATVSV